MSNKVKDISIRKLTYFFFDPDNTKIDENSYKNFIIYYIGYVTIKDLRYVRINSANSLYLIFSNLNEYFEEINKSKYLMVVPANKSKLKFIKHEELWSKTRFKSRFN